MRDLELVGLDGPVLIEEKVEVNFSGSPLKGFCPSEFRFDLLQGSKKILGFQIAFKFDDAIDKPVLRPVTDWLCFVEGGFGQKFVVV
jgi:hypothetical protein